MSNETKRDVFDDLLDAYDDAVAVPGALHPTGELLDYDSRYAAALPDDIPTIPKRVSKEIRDAYGKSSLLDELVWANRDALPSSKVSAWINDHENLFAEAWSRGLWIVDETGEVTGYDA